MRGPTLMPSERDAHTRQIRACEGCGAALRTTGRGWHRLRWCSKECKLAARRARERQKRQANTETVTCDVCGEPYERIVLPERMRTGARCKSCVYSPGPTHHNWKGGWFNKVLNRWIVHTPDGREIYRSRWVMEQHIGRPVRADEHVHHINRDKSDDRLENLQLMSASEHKRLHGKERAEQLVAAAKAWRARKKAAA